MTGISQASVYIDEMHPTRYYYVYSIFVDGVVRYIGKGLRDRILEHERIARMILKRRAAGETIPAPRFYNRLVRAMMSGASVEHKMIAQNLSNSEACDLEIEEIAKARSIGELWNTQSGGNGLSSVDAKEMWKNPEYRAKVTRALRVSHQTPEFRKRISAALTDAFKRNPEYRKRVAEGTRKGMADPIVRQRLSEIKKQQTTTREARLKASEKFKRLWDDPDYRSRTITARTAAGRRQSADSRAKTSEGIKAFWHNNPEKRAKRNASISAAHLNPARKEYFAAIRRDAWAKRRQNRQLSE